MRISYQWLQDHFDKKLPPPEKLGEVLTLHAYEVEGIEEKNGDTLLDIDVLPNRSSDSLSHAGIAKEIATLFAMEMKEASLDFEVDENLNTKDHTKLTVQNSKLVPRAMKRLVVDVRVGESPEWLVQYLGRLGQRSINNIVDATNYVTLETGQPVHAFDFGKIEGDITVRNAREGEEVETLDGEIFTLSENDVVIADDTKALDIAGIKGGSVSGIDENTTRILLSVCNFNPVTIRKTSQRLGLRTEASMRFENGLAPELTERAMELLSSCCVKLAEGKASSDVLDVYPRPRNPYKVGVSTDRVNKLLGTDLKEKDVERILERLGFEQKTVTPREKVVDLARSLDGIPYLYGASISYDAPKAFDCSSFIAYVFAHLGIGLPRMVVDQYVYGEEVSEGDLKPGDLIFANRGVDGTTEHIDSLGIDQKRKTSVSQNFLPGTKLPEGADHNGIYVGDGKVIHASGKWDKGKVVVENIKTSKGFEKIMGYRRIPKVDEKRFVVTVPDERLDLRIEEDLVEEIGRVHGYANIKPVAISEKLEPKVNKTFYYTNKIRDILVENGFSEVMTYSLVDKGEVELKNPLASDKDFMRARLYNNMFRESILLNGRNADLFGIKKVNFFEIGHVFSKDSEYVSLIVAGDTEKAINVLNESLDTKIKSVSDEVVEINLTELVEKLPDVDSYDDLVNIDTSSVAFKPISQYPFVSRDIALWCPKQVESQEVHKVIEQEAGDFLANSYQFDEYAKEDKVSYAFRLVFQSQEKTLTDEEVNKIMDEVTKAVEKKGWEVR